MFHVKDNFKHLFGKEAARAFNAIAKFLNNISPGDYIDVERPEFPAADRPPRIVLRYDALAKNFVVGKDPDSTSDAGGFPSDEVEQTEEVLWTAGGDKGADLLVLFRGEADAEAGTHRLYAAHLVISKDGLIRTIKAAGNGGVEIGA